MPYNLYNKAGIMIPPALRGYLLGLRTVITATGATNYTPSKFAKLLYFQLQGAGGGGKNCANAAAGQIVLGGGGSAGSYSEIIVPSFQGTWVVTVGTGGSGATGASGGATSVTQPSVISGIATIANAVGGTGGGTLASGNTQVFVAPTNGSAGTSALLVAINGHVAYEAFRNSGTVARSGRGADSYFGGGGRAVIAQGAGNAGGNGAGGSGGMSVNAGGAVNGGNGGNGLAIVWEYY